MRSRPLVATLVAAVGLSVLNAPHANPAEIGPLDSNGECSVSYTDAEFTRLVDDVNTMMDVVRGYHEHALETVYPGTIQLMETIRKSAVYEQTVASVFAGTPANPGQTQFTSRENLDRIDAQFGEQAATIGLPASALRQLVTWSSLIDWIRPQAELREQAESIEAFPDHEEGFSETNKEEFARWYPGLTASQTTRAVDAYNVQVRRAAAGYQEHSDATAKAREACAAGGDATVPFPTDNNSNSGSSIGPSADEADNGLIAGVIAAIVGVLVAVGGLFAFAPQLGIELPRLPSL